MKQSWYLEILILYTSASVSLAVSLLSRGRAATVNAAVFTSPLRYEQHLLIADISLGDGRSFRALIDTGSGNLAVPSADCSSPGCRGRGRRGFEAGEDSSGRLLPGASDLSLTFSTGTMQGSAFQGKVCLGHACGQAGFLVAAWESPDFARFHFDAILGLGPPRQALKPEFNIIGELARQSVLPQQAFLLSLRSHGNSSLILGSSGNFGINTTKAAGLPPWLAADARHGEWAVHLQDITVDGKNMSACGTKGCRAVLDSGCGVVALPTPVIDKMKRRLTLHGCSDEAIQELPTLGFVLGNGQKYELTPEKYVEVATQSTSEELTDDDVDSEPHCRLRIQPSGEFARTAILGLPFLLDRDIAFDQAKMRVGLADALSSSDAPQASDGQ